MRWTWHVLVALFLVLMFTPVFGGIGFLLSLLADSLFGLAVGLLQVVLAIVSLIALAGVLVAIVWGLSASRK